jgi:hypothetical protein
VAAQQDVVATQGVLHTETGAHDCPQRDDRQPRASAMDGAAANTANKLSTNKIRFIKKLLRWAKGKVVNWVLVNQRKLKSQPNLSVLLMLCKLWEVMVDAATIIVDRA